MSGVGATVEGRRRSVGTLGVEHRPDGAQRGWAAAVQGGRFTHVGPRDEVQAAHPGRTVVELPQHVLMPGLVDTHTHLTQAFGKSLAFGEPSEIFKRIWVPMEGVLDTHAAYLSAKLAAWESLIGLGLLSGRFLRATLFLLFLQMPGTMMPLLLFPDQTFRAFPYAPTMEGQYIIKNVVLVSAAFVVGATVRGGGLVSDSASLTLARAREEDEEREADARAASSG